jgi:hypothetical protein
LFIYYSLFLIYFAVGAPGSSCFFKKKKKPPAPFSCSIPQLEAGQALHKKIRSIRGKKSGVFVVFYAPLRMAPRAYYLLVVGAL